MNARMMLVVLTSFLFAFILTLLPMPEWAVWLRPAWVLLVLIFWSLVFPDKIGSGTAFLLGLMLDILNGTLLGEHALAMTVVSYLLIKMQFRFKLFSLLQQGLWVFWLVFLYQLVIYCIQGFMNDLPKSHLYWMSSVISLFLWPWMMTILRNVYRRFRTV